MQTVTGCSKWPITQTQVYLKAYHPARDPHTMLLLSAWLCCRYWHPQPKATFICWANKLPTLKLNRAGHARQHTESSRENKTQGSELSSSYCDFSMKHMPFVIPLYKSCQIANTQSQWPDSEHSGVSDSCQVGYFPQELSEIESEQWEDKTITY